MKNLFGKILVGVASCAMAFSMSAFAADIADLNVNVLKDEAGKVTGEVVVSGKIENASAESSDATILVVESGKSLLEVKDEQIKYIDQDTVKPDGTFSYTFKLQTGAEYDVYCGGTDVAAPADQKAVPVKDAEVASKFKLVGKFSVSNNKYGDAEAYAVAGDTKVVGAVAAAADNTYADYAIEVEPGTYDVVVGKPGFLYKTYTAKTVTDADVTVDGAVLALLAGELTGDEAININDLTALLGVYEQTAFEDKFDLTGDGIVNINDLTTFLGNYEKNYDSEE